MDWRRRRRRRAVPIITDIAIIIITITERTLHPAREWARGAAQGVSSSQEVVRPRRYPTRWPRRATMRTRTMKRAVENAQMAKVEVAEEEEDLGEIFFFLRTSTRIIMDVI